MTIATWKGTDEKEYSGRVASIATNTHSNVLALPWAIYLDDGRLLSQHGSYPTAYAAFKRYGLVSNMGSR